MTDDKLTYKNIAIFWLPLFATWLMMSLEGPYLAAIIARLSEPKYNLAAYGVAFSLALMIEAPIIMMMSAATALVKDGQSYRKLRDFTFILNASITTGMLLLVIPPVFSFVAKTLIGLPPRVAELTHAAMVILIPWPGAIGFRRFYQGIMIRHKTTRRVAYGTVIRLAAMSTTALLLYQCTSAPGVIVGASALSTGVTLEALVSRWMVRNIVKNIRLIDLDSAASPLTFKYISTFYYPLALTSVLTMAAQPMVTFFMGQSKQALESLAVMPVINGLVFLFRSIGLSYQEVALAYLGGNPCSYRKVRNFAVMLGAASMVGLSTLAFSPLAGIWYSSISGLSKELSEFAYLPTQILAIMPGTTVLISFQRAVLINAKRTSFLTLATAIEVAGIVVVMFMLIYFFAFIGAVAAASGLIMGRIAANGYLLRPYRLPFDASRTPA